MKKLFSLSVVMLFTFAIYAQNPGISFGNKVHDFGQVQEEGGRVTATFDFTNDGDMPLVINDVKASCGCTVTDWTREPINSNEKGFVKVAYNPKGRPGTFNKSVTVRSNADPETVRLSIKGEVVRSVSQNN